MQNMLMTEQNNVSGFPNSVSQESEKIRSLTEVQGAIIIARKFPRNEFAATKKIMDAAKRLSLAQKAMYCYPRGGEQVTGPSIRAAETIAKYWGNLDYGIKEVYQDLKNHSSDVIAYCWDLEQNVRRTINFKVQHIRVSKNKSAKNSEDKYNVTILTDPRDIYEKVANDGARRVRACILGILPSDIVEDFLEECAKTMVGDNTEPFKIKVSNMIKVFESLGVTQEMIEKRIGTRAENFIPKNLVDLGAIYNSVKNNFAPVEQYFDFPTQAEKKSNELTKKIKDEKQNVEPKQQQLLQSGS